MEQTIHSLRQLNIDREAKSFIENNRNWWSFADAVEMARNPLIRVQKSDKLWRPQLTKALKEAGIIKKDVDKKDLSVFYLYVAAYMARRTWMTNHDELWSKLEDECYQITCEGLPEGTFEKVVKAVRSGLKNKQAIVILTRYGFITERIYKSYNGLKRQLPAGYQYSSEYLKVLEQEALKELQDILPPVFERVAKAHELRNRHHWFYNRDAKDMENIRHELLEQYGITLF
ncbi:MAG: hypothetical protein K6G36_01170 [Candidatus Saccharibacteria bacterium]|nr:hypothetical protein [Candidatus Saccharibacteria bacterium]